MLAAIPFMASFLTLPGTLLIEATGKRKWIFLVGLYFQRLMWIPIALVPTVDLTLRWQMAAGRSPSPRSSSLMFLMYCRQAVGGPGWIGWMSDLIPPGIRGTYFSRRRQWGLLSGIPAAWGAGWLLDHFAGAGQCCIHDDLVRGGVPGGVRCSASLDICTSFIGCPNVPTPPKKGTDLLRAWGEPLRNRDYLRFAGFVGTLVFAFAPDGSIRHAVYRRAAWRRSIPVQQVRA